MEKSSPPVCDFHTNTFNKNKKNSISKKIHWHYTEKLSPNTPLDQFKLRKTAGASQTDVWWQTEMLACKLTLMSGRTHGDELPHDWKNNYERNNWSSSIRDFQGISIGSDISAV